MSIPTAAVPTTVRRSFCLVDADGTVFAAQDAAQPFYAASTIKLHILLTALRAADAGRLDLTRCVPATRTFVGRDGRPFTLVGDHLDPTHPADGVPVRVGDLLVRMIDRSSNEATDHVLTVLGETSDAADAHGEPDSVAGLAAVADVVSALGLERTRLERLIGDPAAVAAGATNETSAYDLARTILALARGEGLSDASTELARRALRAQRIRVIATALRAGTDIGSKSGEVDGYRHDVAFVGDPAGAGLRALAVLTAGMPVADADAEIAACARRLLPDVAASSPEGGARMLSSPGTARRSAGPA